MWTPRSLIGHSTAVLDLDVHDHVVCVPLLDVKVHNLLFDSSLLDLNVSNLAEFRHTLKLFFPWGGLRPSTSQAIPRSPALTKANNEFQKMVLYELNEFEGFRLHDF